ncbi:conserved hypothetical protein [Theileria orientalis strain Shintoku]|uniref:Uncharacterized protein n=1 Tax=Theileria orientalis strain Shintoku TaxID=869250 RepID=J4DPG1_THEOR|nr:conserved hypothetical protein [Theileria orientalis strain Shintoku]BAM40644.1 conserved hypothetical protein [Theileria orientalis strain Shintoku]|eukprot:XP_009690945.1 conserved hypothetical protein [Theileria orientalis strain Shintoku]
MAHQYLKRYYRLDLYSSCIFPLFLFYQILFSDNTKSVDALLKKIVIVHMFTNTIMILYHVLVLPFLVKLTGSEDLQQQKSMKVEVAIFIVRHRLKEKMHLLARLYLYLLFLVFVLTTNNSPIYLLNYAYISMLFISVYFGTIVHFVLLPNSDQIEGYSRHLSILSSEMDKKFILNQVEDNIVLNYEHSPMLYKLCIIQVALGIFGVCFGNYLLLLDWFQLFARFPVTTYLGIFLGHLLSSVACNLAIMGGKETTGSLSKGREYSSKMERNAGESESVKRPRRGFIEFLLS